MAITPAQYDLLVSPAILQEALLDKETGLAMASGIVTFYQDSQRQTLKNVYYQTNAAGSYQYIPIPNPNTLTANGCLADPGGNAILPFYFPYDESDDTVAQPYYITVVNEELIPQFTLQNFPFNGTGNISPDNVQQNLLNFMPNPQFAAHNNAPNNQYPNGVSASTGFTVAPGGSLGWYFTKPQANTDTDFLEFTYITAEPNGLPGNPRWAFNPSCDAASGSAAFKELHVRFDNVNRFASLSQNYTLGFWGLNNNSGSALVTVYLYKYFGSGGATSITTPLAQFSLTSTYQLFSTAFVFGENGSDIIGPNNDDYFELIFSFPATVDYNVAVTDFILTPGVVTLETFPERPDHDVFATGIAGSMPTPDPAGMDLYLPIIYTPTGFNFDTSTIGNIYASLAATTPVGYLYCDGTTYFANQYSSAGIPYARLGNFLYNAGSYGNVPQFGTGKNFATAYSASADTAGNVYISSNKSGTATPVSDGATMTNFTIATQFAGVASAYGIFTQRQGTTGIFLRCNTANGGSGVTIPSAGTSGFGVNVITNAEGVFFSMQISGITDAASLTNNTNPADYWKFSNTTTNYYVWYKVTTEEDPTPGGTGIFVQLVATDTAADVTYKTLVALQASWLSRILVKEGSDITSGMNLSFAANGVTYLPYYQVGSTAAPVPTGGTPILIEIVSSDTAAEVASATIAAINQFAFGVPDFRGLFLRGTDPNSFFDPSSFRTSLGNNTTSTGAGTFEVDTLQDHNHTYIQESGNTAFFTSELSGAAIGQVTVNTGYTGYEETRPVNAAVNWIIKY